MYCTVPIASLLLEGIVCVFGYGFVKAKFDLALRYDLCWLWFVYPVLLVPIAEKKGAAMILFGHCTVMNGCRGYVE